LPVERQTKIAVLVHTTVHNASLQQASLHCQPPPTSFYYYYSNNNYYHKNTIIIITGLNNDIIDNIIILAGSFQQDLLTVVNHQIKWWFIFCGRAGVSSTLVKHQIYRWLGETTSSSSGVYYCEFLLVAR
jgi:hypothetical protein